MSEKSISDVLQDIKKLEERGTISPEEKDSLWRRALQEGPSDDLIDDIEVYRNRQAVPVEIKKDPAPQRQPSSQPPAIGIVAIALGGVSLFMPYIINIALVPVALVCGFVAYHSPASRKLGRIALILSVISLIFVLYTSNKLSSIFSLSKPILSTNEHTQTTRPKLRYSGNITAYELALAFDINEVAADSEFTGKLYMVIGDVDDIGIGLLDTLYVEIDGGNCPNIYCSFSKEQRESLKRLSRGMEVRVIGIIDGKTLGSVHMKDCSLR